jgi:hypothetical protein
MSMKKAFVMVCSLLLGALMLPMGCGGDSEGNDPSLVGVWTDENNLYYFKTDLKYGIKYLRKGQGNDSILTDSVFGNYSVDTRRNNVSFFQEGFVLRPDSLVLKPLSGTTWNYKITGNTLVYESRTTSGTLIRVP